MSLLPGLFQRDLNCLQADEMLFPPTPYPRSSQSLETHAEGLGGTLLF